MTNLARESAEHRFADVAAFKESIHNTFTSKDSELSTESNLAFFFWNSSI
jgi:hypothetical protein